MVGDFCKLRSIERERTCDSRFWHTVEKKELRTMRRCKCPELRWKLELLRTTKPSVEQLKKILKGHKAPNRDKRSSFKMQAPTADDIAGVLQETPHRTFATITRASAALVAEWAVAYLFGGCIPEACVPADPESNPENFVGSEQVYHYVMQLAIYICMALTLTRNLNKSGGYVNGQRVTVVDVFQNGILTQTATGKLIMVHPYTDQETGVVLFPIRLGYATTLHKIQGATLDHLTIWLDVPNVEAAAYVALSRVRFDEHWRFIGDPTIHCFTPSSGF